MNKEFYRLPIFWAGLAIVAAFFIPAIPWVEFGNENISGQKFVELSGKQNWINYVFYLFPAAGAFLVLGPLVGLGSYTGLARWTIILLVVFFLLREIFNVYSYGFWITIIATIVLYYDSRIFGEEEY